jgi:glycosidase
MRFLLCLLAVGLLALSLAACDWRPTAPTAVPTSAPPATAATPTPARAVPVQPVSGLPAGTDGYPWWNDTVFYEIFVRSFYDSNGDGIGDFNGLTAKLDYLNDGDPKTTTDLGVTGLWLMPIHPSPSYHGYDVTDYYSVNPQYGTRDDFQRLLAEAHKRGIRIIIDLVLNHTSSQHPWFVQARDRQSPYRGWYIWSDIDPGFTGPWGQKVWYPAASGYYYAVFWEGMPDLNYRNPAVTAQMQDVARFWLQDVGVDGFRLDGARHLIEEGAVQADSDLTLAWFKTFRKFYQNFNPQSMTVGEVWTTTDVVAKYVQGDQFDLAFNFDLANAFVSSAQKRAASDAQLHLALATHLFQPGQFATFLTNHDQNRVMSVLGDDVGQAKAAATLLLTAPGVPFLYYGEEIGQLGRKPDEDIRRPLQWTGEASAGFSTGIPWRAPFVDYEKKNVAAQSNDASSLLAHYRTLIRLRNEHAALRLGDYHEVKANNKAVFASLRAAKGEVVLVVANLSKDAARNVQLSLDAGPLSGQYAVVPILGSGTLAGLTSNAAGGFDAYTLPELPANGSLILQLQRRP